MRTSPAKRGDPVRPPLERELRLRRTEGVKARIEQQSDQLGRIGPLYSAAVMHRSIGLQGPTRRNAHSVLPFSVKRGRRL